jgi:hypothetical protein
MTVAGALPFPGSRTLANWARQLDSWQPGALWVGHILLHRVEALVRRTLAIRVDPLQALVLQALAVTPGESLQALQARLHLDRQLLERLLCALESAGLSRLEGGWQSTDLGRQALDQGTQEQQIRERRVFYFVEQERSDQHAHFLPFADPPTLPWAASSEWRFDVGLLSACVTRPVEWKRRFGFPLDVEAVAGNEPGLQGAEAWHGVILDRPERLAVVLTLPQDGSNRLLGFAAQEKGWALASRSPLFALDEGWREAFPGLAVDLPLPTSWTDAWRAWAQAHGWAKGDAEQVQLRPEGHRLLATVPRALAERLRGEAIKGETWLLAGSGRLKAAAVVEVHDANG